jgi:glycine cleavage system H lipoate-binding protein
MNLKESQHTEKGKACVWTKGGGAKNISCELDFQCGQCQVDKDLWAAAENNRKHRREGGVAGDQSKGVTKDVAFSPDRLKRLPLGKRPCIHYANGTMDYRACIHDYQCETCEFDQYVEDDHQVHVVSNPVDVMDVRSFKMPQGYYFHKGHTWVRLEEDNQVRIGLDEFALRLLGPIDRITAPLVGSRVEQGRTDISLSRNDNHARVMSPVTGVVTAINAELRDTGSLANKDPYAKGWVMRVHAEGLRVDLKNLKIGEESGVVLNREIDRLYDVIEEAAGPLAADGGFLADDIYGHLPQVEWERLTRLFLRT